MRVGILGPGDVGKSLGDGFIKYGHEVMMGSRTPESDKVRSWVRRAGKAASAGTYAEAAVYGEVVVLAVPWSGCKNTIDLAGARNLLNKVVLDVANPLIFEPEKPPRLSLGHTDSGGEQVQRWLVGSNVVKVFNIIGHTHMVDPDFPDGPPDMFICGDDSEAKKKVAVICNQFGWPRVTDIGGMEGARELEPVCILWVKYGMLNQSWNHAFKLIRK